MARPRATEEQREAQRQRIRAAAREIYESSGGAERVSIRRVAARAGVSQGTIYSYFTDRTELLRSLWLEPVQEASRGLERVAAEISDPVERDPCAADRLRRECSRSSTPMSIAAPCSSCARCPVRVPRSGRPRTCRSTGCSARPSPRSRRAPVSRSRTRTDVSSCSGPRSTVRSVWPSTPTSSGLEGRGPGSGDGRVAHAIGRGSPTGSVDGPRATLSHPATVMLSDIGRGARDRRRDPRRTRRGAGRHRRQCQATRVVPHCLPSPDSRTRADAPVRGPSAWTIFSDSPSSPLTSATLT